MGEQLAEVKQLVQAALEKKGTLNDLRAQLRAQVFIIVDEHEKSTGGPGLAAKTANPSREALLKDPNGQLLLGLVNELLEYAKMDYTRQVYGPELGVGASAYVGRSQLASKLGIADAPRDAPLLLGVLNAFLAGGGSTGAARAWGSLLNGASACNAPDSCLGVGSGAIPSCRVQAVGVACAAQRS